MSFGLLVCLPFAVLVCYFFFFALSSCSCIRDIKINRYGIPLVEMRGEECAWRSGTAIWEFLCLLGNVSAGGVGAQNCTQRVFEREGRKPPFIPRCVKNASSCMSGGASECAAVGGCLVVLGKGSSPCEIALQAMFLVNNLLNTTVVVVVAHEGLGAAVFCYQTRYCCAPAFASKMMMVEVLF